MDILLRAIAISIEVILLAGLFGCILVGVWLAVFDLGIKLKYEKAVIMALVAIGSIIVVFIISHLISFYPTI